MEKIIESQNTTSVLQSDGWTTEVTKLQVWLDSVTIEWNEDGTGGNFQISASLKTESGNTLRRANLSKPISVLDAVNVPTSPHNYMRDQLYLTVVAADPFGLGTWNKLYS